MLKKINNYLSLIRFSHTVFALPFACIGFILGVKNVHALEFKLLGLMLLCMILARSAAMAFNRLIDRHFDKLNPRTREREIPAGVINPIAALLFTVISSLGFIGSCWFINPLCFYLSPIALLIILGYSYTKRFTSLCHLILGLGLSLAPVGAYLTVTEKFALVPILFSVAVLTWVSGFDILYALPDRDFDQGNRLHSIPVRWGNKGALQLSALLHFISFAFIIFCGLQGDFGIVYWIGSVLFGILLIYQHSIVKPHDLSRINLAFGTTNGIASIVFAAFTISDILWMQ